MIIDYFRHGWTRLLKKTRLAARWVKAIFAKGYTKSIDTARYRRAN